MRINKEKMMDAVQIAAASMNKNLVPGIAMAYFSEGKLIHTETAGTADPETGAAVTENTHFEAASLTKPVFARLVLQLADKGLIDLDRPLSEYAPEAMPSDDERCKNITAKHVLSHGTGLPNWGDTPLPLAFEPGTSFGYSGKGYTYLQDAVEKITGRRTDDLMQTEIFNPLGMEDAAMIWTGPLNRTLARTVDGKGNLEPPRDRCQHSVAREPNSAFSLHVTIKDYPKFVQAVMADKALIEKIYSHTNPADHGVVWGLGWGTYKDIIWHWGDNGGFKSLVCFDPKTKDGLLIHTNGFNGLEVCYDVASYVAEYDFSDIKEMIANAE